MIGSLLIAALLGGGGEGARPPAARIEVLPEAVRLEGARDAEAILVLATSTTGTTDDRTDEVALRVLDPAIARLEDGRLVPVADGTTQLVVGEGGTALSVQVEVSGASEDPELDFNTDVLPWLTSMGCNTGSCHGSARGQDGFLLSLFGYDPRGDVRRVVEEYPGRRVDLTYPEHSLLIEKALGVVPHTGGRLMEEGSPGYRALVRWIDEGCRPEGADAPSLVDIEVLPRELVLAGPGQEARVLVRARYSDGTDRDVSHLAVLRTSNEASVALQGRGVVSRDAGEAFVSAAYGPHTVGLPVIVLPASGAHPWADPAEGVAPSNWIDEAIAGKHRRLGIAPSALCDDATFLRRAHLDLIGLLPTPERRAAFLADERPTAEKRAALVDELLERKEFTELQVSLWAERLGIRSSNQVSDKAALRWFEWLDARLGAGAGADDLVRELLTAQGGTFATPQTNFWQAERDTLKLSENAAQAFLGIRLQCAQCHNHPFDRWTQDDYYGYAAFFAQVGRKQAEDPREQVIFDRGGGNVRHPVTNRPVEPRLLGDRAIPDDERDRRAVLASWMVSSENPWFARAEANRLWAQLMGRGLVEPVDDFRVSNPATVQSLLDALAERLVAADYDPRALVREICASRAYQRSAEPTPANAHDQDNHARARVRRLRAETLLDAICQVTDDPEKHRGLPLGARAVQIADGATTNHFLRVFGRSERKSVCACESTTDPSLSQALHLLNGQSVHDKIRKGGLVEARLAEGTAPLDVARALFVRCLVREADAAELRLVEEELAVEGADPREVLEDLFWSLLNSREFQFQH